MTAPAHLPSPGSGAGRAAGLRPVAATALACGRAAFVVLSDRRGRANRRLVAALAVVVGLACVAGLPELLRAFIAGNDIEIPLRAASRWAAGGDPYPASAMSVIRGPDLPYLYPPFLLPFLVPLADLPRVPVTAAWIALCCLSAAWTCRRLGAPWPAVPLILCWPPFAEGLIAGNVQIVSFAAFVAVFYERRDGRPVQRRLGGGPARDAADGMLAAAVGVFKATQGVAMLNLAVRRFRSAVLGAAAVAAIAAATLPLTGISLYWDWLAQLQRAADPGWLAGGAVLQKLIGLPSIVAAIAGALIALASRGRDAVAWLGVAMILAAPLSHGYTMLFIVPGLLVIRRDLALLLATLCLGNYHQVAWLMLCLFVPYMLVAGRRWPWLRAVDAPEPAAAVRTATDAAAPLPGGGA